MFVHINSEVYVYLGAVFVSMEDRLLSRWYMMRGILASPPGPSGMNTVDLNLPIGCGVCWFYVYFDAYVHELPTIGLSVMCGIVDRVGCSVR